MILNMYISKLNSFNYVHDNGTIDITHIQYHKIWGTNLSSCRFQATKTGGQRRNLQDQLSSGLFHPMELRTPNPPRTHSNFLPTVTPLSKCDVKCILHSLVTPIKLILNGRANSIMCFKFKNNTKKHISSCNSYWKLRLQPFVRVSALHFPHRLKFFCGRLGIVHEEMWGFNVQAESISEKHGSSTANRNIQRQTCFWRWRRNK